MALHVVQAVEGLSEQNMLTFTWLTSISGFFRSISLRNQDALQDTLRLLTLWFKYGSIEDVSHAMAGGFSTVEVDTWLEVIPQASDQEILKLYILNLIARSLPEFKHLTQISAEISITCSQKSANTTLKLSYIP